MLDFSVQSRRRRPEGVSRAGLISKPLNTLTNELGVSPSELRPPSTRVAVQDRLDQVDGGALQVSHVPFSLFSASRRPGWRWVSPMKGTGSARFCGAGVGWLCGFREKTERAKPIAGYLLASCCKAFGVAQRGEPILCWWPWPPVRPSLTFVVLPQSSSQGAQSPGA